MAQSLRYYQRIKLKNGKDCILRNPTAEDAQAIIYHMIKTSEESDNMLRYSDEIARTVKYEDEFSFLKMLEDADDQGMICAVVDGIIVANAGFHPVGKTDKVRHRCEFGISVQREYWHQGIGYAILCAIKDQAKAAGYTQIELDVVTDNQRGLGLYQKCGFEIIGKNMRHLRKRDNSYQACYIMCCVLD